MMNEIFLMKIRIIKVFFVCNNLVDVYLSVHLPVCLSVCLPVCLPVCLYVCLPVCLSICLFVCLSVQQKTLKQHEICSYSL